MGTPKSGVVKVEFRYEVEIEYNPVFDDGKGGIVVEGPSLEEIVNEDGKLTDLGKEYAGEMFWDGITDYPRGLLPRHTVTVEEFPNG